MPVFIIVVIAVMLIGIFGSIVMVPKDQAFIVERLGQFHQVYNEGMHYRVPMIDRIVMKVDLRELAADAVQVPMVCADDKAVFIDYFLTFRISDPQKFCYNAGGTYKSLEKLLVEAIITCAKDISSQEAEKSLPKVKSLVSRAVSQSAPILGFTLTDLKLSMDKNNN